MTQNEKEFLNTIKSSNKNFIELLNIIANSDNPEEAIIKASKIIFYFSEHPEVYDKPREEQIQIMESIA